MGPKCSCKRWNAPKTVSLLVLAHVCPASHVFITIRLRAGKAVFSSSSSVVNKLYHVRVTECPNPAACQFMRPLKRSLCICRVQNFTARCYWLASLIRR